MKAPHIYAIPFRIIADYFCIARQNSSGLTEQADKDINAMNATKTENAMHALPDNLYGFASL